MSEIMADDTSVLLMRLDDDVHSIEVYDDRVRLKKMRMLKPMTMKDIYYDDIASVTYNKAAFNTFFRINVKGDPKIEKYGDNDDNAVLIWNRNWQQLKTVYDTLQTILAERDRQREATEVAAVKVAKVLCPYCNAPVDVDEANCPACGKPIVIKR
jgi:hypothetical protein